MPCRRFIRPICHRAAIDLHSLRSAPPRTPPDSARARPRRCSALVSRVAATMVPAEARAQFGPGSAGPVARAGRRPGPDAFKATERACREPAPPRAAPAGGDLTRKAPSHSRLIPAGGHPCTWPQPGGPGRPIRRGCYPVCVGSQSLWQSLGRFRRRPSSCLKLSDEVLRRHRFLRRQLGYRAGSSGPGPRGYASSDCC